MDRIFEMVNQINSDWTVINDELRQIALRQKEMRGLSIRYDELREQFANIITLGQDDAWRFFAEANGIDLPEDE
jgi:hypothetical protein